MRLSNSVVRFACCLCVCAIILGAGGTAGADATPVRTIFLDPGHGGKDVGAVRYDTEGEPEMLERDINLAVALKTERLLLDKGYQVILSRGSGERPGNGEDVNGDGRVNRRDELQAVVDSANESNVDLFLGIHSNSSHDSTDSGVEVYYCSDREFGEESLRLAKLLQANFLLELRAIGHQAEDRGVKDDTVLYSHGRWEGHLFVLGPIRTRRGRSDHPRATEMPGALGEGLFMSNDTEAEILASDEGQWALARSYVAAVEAYFRSDNDEPSESGDFMRGY